MTDPQDDRASLVFILSVYAVSAVLAYMVFKMVMLTALAHMLNSGTSISLLLWLPDLIFATAIVLIGAAIIFAYRRRTARLAQMAEAGS